MRKAVTPKTMELIKSSDLYFGRKGLWARWRARAIMKLAALDRINRLYSDALAYEGPNLFCLLFAYGEYDKDGWRVPNPSALPWQKNNFKGAFELKSQDGSFGIRIEVQKGRENPFFY